MSTPTSTNGLDGDEGGEAISSTYRRQQRCPIPAKPTPPRPRIRPPNQALPRGNYHPTPRNSSTRGTGPPRPDPHPTSAEYVSTVDSLDTASRNVQPTAVSTALPLAQPAPPAAEPTTMPSCAGTRECGIRATRHHDRRRPTPPDLGRQIRSVEPEALTPSTQHRPVDLSPYR